VPPLGSVFSWARRQVDVQPPQWLRRIPGARLRPTVSLLTALKARDWALLLNQTKRRANLSPRKFTAAISAIVAALAISGTVAYLANGPHRRAAAPAALSALAAADKRPNAAQPAKISDSILTQGWTSLAEAYQVYAVHIAADSTLLSDDGTIQLYGIKMPNRSQVCTYQTGDRWACGQRAYIALLNFVGRTTIACRLRNSDQAGVFVCKLAGIDIGRWLLRNGWATLADGVADKSYVAAANEGLTLKVGMWVSAP
jgi:endonuclease YncB( thermonuclease family)